MPDIPNLWPADLANVKAMLTPFGIFKKQAAALAERTEGRLEGKVTREIDPEGDMVYSFKIASKTLQYAYELFVAWHEPTLVYPVTCRFKNLGPIRCDDEGALLAWLREVFASTETKRIINSLMTQADE